MNVVHFLSNPEYYNLVRKEEMSVNSTNRDLEINVINNNEDIDEVISNHETQHDYPEEQNYEFHSDFHPLPEHMKIDIQVDCMIYTAKPDGACLFNCASEWLLGSSDRMRELQKCCHGFIVENYDFYKHIMSLRFHETIGVGNYARHITIQTHEEFISFLLSEESLYSYSASSIDLSCIATLFNINIYAFV